MQNQRLDSFRHHNHKGKVQPKRSPVLKVLINTPELSKNGGVASYYHVVRPYFDISVDYFTVGARTDGEHRTARVMRLFRDYWCFAKRLGLCNYDAVHLNPSFLSKALVRDGLFLLVAKAFRKRVIVFFHGWDMAHERRLRRRWLRLFRWAYFRADAFVVLGEEFRAKLIDMGCDKPIYLETTTVDDAVFERLGARIADPAGDDKSFNLLYLSRVERAKGIYEALDAYAIVKRHHPQAMLRVVGDGEELARARAYAEKRNLQDVVFPGYLHGEQKHDALMGADCYFFPTYYGEGMPTSVLEAMAYGLPVITRPVGGLKDFFEHGKMGFISESKEPQVFADHIEELIRKPELRGKMGEYNRAYAKEQFMASKVAQRIERIYRAVLGTKAEMEFVVSPANCQNHEHFT